MTNKTFNYGKYNGREHKEIARLDPSYILHVYENFSDNGGVSNEIYRLAQINLNESYEEEFERFEDDVLLDMPYRLEEGGD